LRIGGFFGYELERGEDERARGRERGGGENFIRTVIRRELIYPSLLWGRKLRRDPARQRRIETLHPAEFAWDGSSPRRKFSETFQLDALSEKKEPSLIKIQRGCGRSGRIAMFPG